MGNGMIGRKEVIVQRDGMTPRTCHNTERKLYKARRQGRWKRTLVTQPVQLSDLNISDIGFFAFLKSPGCERGYSIVDNLKIVLGPWTGFMSHRHSRNSGIISKRQNQMPRMARRGGIST